MSASAGRLPKAAGPLTAHMWSFSVDVGSLRNVRTQARQVRVQDILEAKWFTAQSYIGM